MKGFEYKDTTSKLWKSRLIKFSLIAIGCLMIIWGYSQVMIYWIMNGIATGLWDMTIESVSVAVADTLHDYRVVSVITAIATITTAVIARYGIRETTGNLGAGMIGRQEGAECGEN